MEPFFDYLLSSFGHKKTDKEKNEACREAYDKWSEMNIKESDDPNPIKVRKRDIFEETCRVLEMPSDDRIHYLKKRSHRITCELCIACKQCEDTYWNELAKLLSAEQAKSKFMLPEEIRKLLVLQEKPQEMYVNSYRKAKDSYNYQNKLVMLKGFSSSTPLLLNHTFNTNAYSGGGFYFKWNGTGIVMDPGYHFIDNLHACGLNVLDVDIVIITHEHIDHNNDMRLLDDLHYNASKIYYDNKILWDADTGNITSQKTELHKIHWYMDEVSYQIALLLNKKDSGFSTEYNKLYNMGYVVNKSDKGYKEINLTPDIQMKVFQTNHELEKKGSGNKFLPHTFGCAFECGDEAGICTQIGYTSDTAYDKNVPMMDALVGSDILIANISGIYEDDILLQKPKDKHLGYYGCYKLVEELEKMAPDKLKYVLLSEFSNLIHDIRFDTAKYMQCEIQHNIRQNIHVFPAEVGMIIEMKDIKVRCSGCHRYADEVTILRPEEENGKIQYFCSGCTYRLN